jgi:hypothetical protein
MARYSAFLGLQVEVQYRAGDILLPASGTFVGDTGRSIFLEQSLEQKGQHRHFRSEIPYQCIVRLAEKPEPVESAAQQKRPGAQSAVSEIPQPADANREPKNAEREQSASDRLKVSVVFPRPQRSNI